MNKIILVTLSILCFIADSSAQQSDINNDAHFVFRPLVFIDYNIYHWYKPPETSSNTDVGQVFNVLPGIGGGIIMGKKTTFMFLIEAAFKYHPFSLDLNGFPGMGSITFPILGSFRIPIEGFFFFQLGGGIQFTQINIHGHTAIQQSNSNPFFLTYVGELAAGVEENLFLIFFLRYGYNPQLSNTFDFGLRLGLNGNLWE
ncbi:hypothetical protein OAK19_02720 [Aureispira]|nr:hypothetical protein [Aureispira sp.]